MSRIRRSRFSEFARGVQGRSPWRGGGEYEGRGNRGVAPPLITMAHPAPGRTPAPGGAQTRNLLHDDNPDDQWIPAGVYPEPAEGRG